MKHRLFLPLAVIALGAAFGPGCAGGFARSGPNASLTVNITGGPLGTPSARLPIPLGQAAAYVVDVEAHKADGTIDTSFNGFVRASVKPGTVGAVNGDNTDGRNVQLINGVARGVTVNVAAAYGDARIWFEDIGYAPANILRDPPPQCSDGLDNNGNGVVDFPADAGCAFANDDTEDGGQFGTGISAPIYFLAPRIADVRGRTLDATNNPIGGNVTNFPHEQVQINVGWQPNSDDFAFSTLVTRVAADGFYITDSQDDLSADPTKVPGYGSVFAFTFSTPPEMRVCDRLKLLGGTASDFHGFTELGFPTWLLEQWDPSLRKCAVPAPYSFTPTDILNVDLLFKLESSLVRLESKNNWTVHVAQHFGATLVPVDPTDGSYKFTADASNCDFNHNGKVDFDGGAENVCSCYCDGCSSDPRQPNANPPIAIGADPECSEYSQFAGQNEFKVIVVYKYDPNNAPTLTKMQVDGSSSTLFDALALKGQTIRSFTGTLRYFSGGSQFTIEARCDDDIISDPNGAPFCSDDDYEQQVAGCGTLDGTVSAVIPVPFINRRLACVHARSISDNNESSH